MTAELIDESTATSLTQQGWAQLDASQIDRLRSHSATRDVDTHTSGHIVSYSDGAGGFYVMEEDIFAKETYVRHIATQKELDDFYNERTEEYQNMWGSCCGGTVKYKERWEKWSMDKFRREQKEKAAACVK
ncbi:hypothetical protein HDU93_002057 [Gonapodya sp. JEL0774]|nr:hypothetical protein HDU93_002057 [Gonapodya sp. JEL0774]